MIPNNKVALSKVRKMTATFLAERMVKCRPLQGEKVEPTLFPFKNHTVSSSSALQIRNTLPFVLNKTHSFTHPFLFFFFLSMTSHLLPTPHTKIPSSFYFYGHNCHLHNGEGCFVLGIA